MELSVDQKYELITRNLQEKMADEEIIKKILAVRPLKIYWGTCPTNRIHIGYFVQMLKIIDYLQAGCEVTILIADLHAVLDNMKSTFSQIEARTKYYTIMIQELLKSLNVNITHLKFVRGTDFQLSKEYTLDVYKAHTMISVSEAKHAGAEVVKQSDNPKMTGLMYPTLQAIDEQYLDIDAETSGIDQRKIVTHSRVIMPKLGYKKRYYFMTEMVPGLRFVKKAEEMHNQNIKLDKEKLTNLIMQSHDDDELINKLQLSIGEYNKDKELKNNIQLEKMSASNHDSKIDILDTKNQIKTKVNKCYCLPGDTQDNCLMIILEKMVFPILKLKNINFVINRKEEYGGNIIYANIDDIKNDFKSETLHPADFKIGMIDCLDSILEPIRNVFKTKDLTQLVNKAYPNK